MSETKTFIVELKGGSDDKRIYADYMELTNFGGIRFTTESGTSVAYISPDVYISVAEESAIAEPKD